ncbi:MAG: type II toxin-antitoxin system VapC family toxin [Microthrixaceae bacterium]
MPDSSAIVAMLTDDGPTGHWARDALRRDRLVAPHLMPVEVANVLRRCVAAHLISTDTGVLAHVELLDLPVELVAYSAVGPRVWELRHTLTAFDAFYVAVAEAADARVVTLDRRLARATGPRCEFLVP